MLPAVQFDRVTTAAMCVAALGLTAGYSWVCDDATISMRYADNLAGGHGLVFNLGERVQGFTNPLWTLLLAIGAVFESNQRWAVGLGLLCTAGLLAVLAAISRRLELGVWGIAFVLGATFLCDPFLQFQTSGLETSLVNLLVAATLLAALATPRGSAPNLAIVLAALAMLTRLDSLLLTAPMLVAAHAIVGDRPRAALARAWRGYAIAGVLVLGWMSFAALYYGYPLPNTYYAKTGAPRIGTIGLGLRYVADFALLRAPSALVAAVGLAATPRLWRSDIRGDRLLAGAGLGAGLAVLYVVWVGGDYMHGRFLCSPLLVLAIVAARALNSSPRLSGAAPRSRRWLLLAALLVTAAATSLAWRPTHGPTRVTNERADWYGGPIPNFRVGVLPALDLIAEPTLSHHLIGQRFGDDPRIVWIDGYGLVDPFVARCPIADAGRSGHFERRIPLAYMRARGDARLLAHGEARLLAGDPTLGPELARLRADPRWPSAELERRYDELMLLTRGPIFDPARLRLIVKYTLSRQSIPDLEHAEVTRAGVDGEHPG